MKNKEERSSKRGTGKRKRFNKPKFRKGVKHGQENHPSPHRQESGRQYKKVKPMDPIGMDGVFGSLIPEIQHALSAAGYTIPTPVQAKAILPQIEGKDLLGSAQTGTGKTAAFTLPLLQGLSSQQTYAGSRRPKALILAPTRELAAQIGDSIKTYGRFLPITHTVIFGGVGQSPQERAMNKGVDILVATPGRLLDLMGQGFVKLHAVETFVLDEADRMLDMGFIRDIKRIVAELPKPRRTAFFSATLLPEIISLADSMLSKPVRIAINPEQLTIDKIRQRVLFVNHKDKEKLLISILREPEVRSAIVFTRMKYKANRVCERLQRSGIIAVPIHGNRSQSARTKALTGFRNGQVKVLVATDIAARGIDVDGISDVVNYDLPCEPETYVHRIGRTARAGSHGQAWSLCSEDEGGLLRDIERLIKKTVPVETNHDFHSERVFEHVNKPFRVKKKEGKKNSAFKKKKNSRSKRSKRQDG